MTDTDPRELIKSVTSYAEFVKNTGDEIPALVSALTAALDEIARLRGVIEEADAALGDTQHPRYNEAAMQVSKVAQALSKGLPS